MASPFGRVHSREDAADRVGQRGDHLEAGGDRLDAFGVERQPVAQRRGEAPILGLGEVAGIGREDLLGSRPHRRSGLAQCRDLVLGRRKAQGGRGFAGAPPDLGHDGRQIRPRPSWSARVLSVSVVIGVRSPPDRRDE